MKLIDISTPAHPNKFTLVDDEDFNMLSKWKWGFEAHDETSYASRQYIDPVQKDRRGWGKKIYVSMHRLIMNAPKGLEVDHRDGNGLNNQKSNLRICSRTQNMMNKKKYRNNKSGFKGVTWLRSSKKWISQIKVDGKPKYGHVHFCVIKAAKEYDAISATRVEKPDNSNVFLCKTLC